MSSQKYYKFKSCDQFQFVLDILIHNQFFCSDLNSFNDPLESNLGYVTSEREGKINKLFEVYKNEIKSNQFREEFFKNRVLCFTTNIDSHLMWCHYANAFTGVAIEFELLRNSGKAEKVSYGQFLPFINESEINESWTEEEVDNFRIRKTLLNKQLHWKYEDEYRIITKENFVPVKVTKVIMGYKIDENFKKILELLCSDTALSIPLCIVGIGDEGIDADFYEVTGWYK
jgi:hypothetical protein